MHTKKGAIVSIKVAKFSNDMKYKTYSPPPILFSDFQDHSDD